MKKTRKKPQWQPGDPLSEQDIALLQPLKDRACELGRTPTVTEVSTAYIIKQRFRIWKNAILAAGLPALNSPEQTKLREKESRQNIKTGPQSRR